MKAVKFDNEYTNLNDLLNRYAALMEMIDSFFEGKKGCSYEADILIGKDRHRLIVICKRE